jgi:ABC-type transport system substrate-binding protein
MPVTRRLLLGSSIAAAAIHQARAAQKVLRIGISTSLNTLDPMMTTLGDEYIYDNILFNGLTRMNEALAIEPDLAASWSFTPDLKTWTFRLRPGVKFHTAPNWWRPTSSPPSGVCSIPPARLRRAASTPWSIPSRRRMPPPWCSG